MIAAAGLLACGSGDGGAKARPPTSRVNAVAATKAQEVDVQEFCEPWAEPEQAKAFVYPELAAGAPAKGSLRWVNVWATWCKPCIEELPRLVRWRDELAQTGTPVELVLLSVDGDPAAVTAFREGHPEVAGSLEIRDAAGMGPWLSSLGLPETSILPIHLFVDSSERLRCVRMAGVGESDYQAVRQTLMQM